ncbi:uncharacterized protein JN550_007923 [Neoarthrinium moseri]|uniref:uncharacterized protein n=1 Tax=Neoarthrinium moseri TaxID=1658444 RepID=UPI001FDB3FA4|nr:uncharacterized protein JN550_007923 [Neoarthrinium moseri]KAI1865945.1 hypothetical protein JN550_007923 [Neoarthrinium moseri]
MARLQARKRPRIDNHPPDQVPSKRAKLSGVYPVDGPPHDQAPFDRTIPNGVFPKPSRSPNRKRRTTDPLQDQPPLKKPKSRGAVHRASSFPSEFYDNLSKVWLTRRALQEVDRRNDSLSLPKLPAHQKHIRDLAQTIKEGGSDLARFARTGGPDLSDLQGCPEPISTAHTMASISSSVTSKRVSAGSVRTQSTEVTTVSNRSRRSSAYDANFRQHCIDYHIYPPVYKFPDGTRPPKPANFEEIRQALKTPRRSLSPSVVPDTAFDDFQDKNATRSEGTVMRTVVPLIIGNSDILNEGHLPFTNLASITDNTIVNPIPDFFDGAHPEAVNKKVREDLDEIIIPTKKGGVPIAPNFFLEAKGPGGSIEVAMGQAVLDGAHGAHSMHALQNYLMDEPVYDGNAYAFTSTLLDGYLKLYAHHLTAPAKCGQGPSYHITLLKAYALSDDEVYSQGRGAFRNLRIRAKEYRDRFIGIANARVRDRSTEDADTEWNVASMAGEQQDIGSSPLDFYDCRMFAEPDDEEKTQEIQETQQSNVGLAIHTYGDDDVDDAGDSTCFATSFTSSFTSTSREEHLRSQRPPKMPRSPPSPSSTRQSKRAG